MPSSFYRIVPRGVQDPIVNCTARHSFKVLRCNPKSICFGCIANDSASIIKNHYTDFFPKCQEKNAFFLSFIRIVINMSYLKESLVSMTYAAPGALLTHWFGRGLRNRTLFSQLWKLACYHYTYPLLFSLTSIFFPTAALMFIFRTTAHALTYSGTFLNLK